MATAVNRYTNTSKLSNKFKIRYFATPTCRLKFGCSYSMRQSQVYGAKLVSKGFQKPQNRPAFPFFSFSCYLMIIFCASIHVLCIDRQFCYSKCWMHAYIAARLLRKINSQIGPRPLPRQAIRALSETGYQSTCWFGQSACCRLITL